MVQSTATCFCLILLSQIYHVTPECSLQEGPAGWIDCVYNSASSSFQLSACVTGGYAREKTSNQQRCPNATDSQYCYLPCMTELGLSATVTDQCRCAEGGTAVQSTLPSDCLSPTIVDCSWYSRCLAGQYACSGQTGMSILYGEAFCTVYTTPPPQVSRFALGWVYSVRKCFQIQLVPVLRSYGLLTSCNDLQERISNTYDSCYINNTASISACDLSCREFSYYFFTLNSAYLDEYSVLIKNFYNTMIQCSQSQTLSTNLCGYQCDNFYLPSGAPNDQCLEAAVFEVVFESRSSAEQEVMNLIIEDQEAFSIVAKISDRFSWNSTSSIKWYPRVSASLLVDEISIQLLLVDMAALGLMERGSLKSMVDVVKDLADAIRGGLTIVLDGSPTLEMTAKYIRVCNPYGQISNRCNPGQLIATATTNVTTSNSSSSLASTASTNGFQTTTTTTIGSTSFGTRETQTQGTPPKQASTPTDTSTTRAGTPPRNTTPGFRTTTTTTIATASSSSASLLSSSFISSSSSFSSSSLTSSSSSSFSLSSSSSSSSSFSSAAVAATASSVTNTGSTTILLRTLTSGFTPLRVTPGLSTGATVSASESAQNTGSTSNESSSTNGFLTRRNVTPTKDATTITRNITPGFSRPTINP